jgi:glycosyltransferase involved in cell wall biosynthesis
MYSIALCRVKHYNGLMRNALFYLTYNGLYNFTNGIGTQTQLLLSGMEALHETLVAQYGPIDTHLVCPLPDERTWGYDPAFFGRQQHRIAALGGQVHLIPYQAQPAQELWDIRSWEALCRHVAPLLLAQTAAYDRSLIIGVDQPWLQTPRALLCHRSKMPSATDVLLVLYNTAYIRNWDTPDAAELAWEQAGLGASQPGSQVFIADICPSFTSHLHTHFALSTAQLAPYTSSILVSDPIFALQGDAAVRATLQAYGVPLDADLVLAFGRAAPIKGFDRLIPALAPIRDRIHFVLISVPYLDDDAEQRVYDRLLGQYQIRATHVKHFTRDLPRALAQWPRTKMVVAPSRQETFSNIPLEVALWARENGPVVVTSTAGGFVDQIEPGQTGFVVDIASGQEMARTLRQVLDLSDEARAAIRRQAYQRVVEAYDFAHHFPTTLRWFWQAASPQRMAQ